MSFLKNRNGKGFYRIRALNGYIKILFKKNNEQYIGELTNKMTVKFEVE